MTIEEREWNPRSDVVLVVSPPWSPEWKSNVLFLPMGKRNPSHPCREGVVPPKREAVRREVEEPRGKSSRGMGSTFYESGREAVSPEQSERKADCGRPAGLEPPWL